MIHIMLLFHGLTVQSISVDHLPANWDWDAQADSWRVEVFSYLGNMSKLNFLRGLGRAIDVSRGHCFENERGMLFVPEDDAEAVKMARQISHELGIGYKAITMTKADDAGVPSVQELLGQFGVEAANAGDDAAAPQDQPYMPLMNFRPELLEAMGAVVPEQQIPVNINGIQLMGRPFPVNQEFDIFNVSVTEELADAGLADGTDQIDVESLGLRAVVTRTEAGVYETFTLDANDKFFHFQDENIPTRAGMPRTLTARYLDDNGNSLEVNIAITTGRVDSKARGNVVGFWMEGRRVNTNRVLRQESLIPTVPTANITGHDPNGQLKGAPLLPDTIAGQQSYVMAWPAGVGVDVLSASIAPELLASGYADLTDLLEVTAVRALLFSDPASESGFTIAHLAPEIGALEMNTDVGPYGLSGDIHYSGHSMLVRIDQQLGSMISTVMPTLEHGPKIVGFWLTGHRTNSNRRPMLPTSEADTNQA